MMSEEHTDRVGGQEDAKLRSHPLRTTTRVFPLNSKRLTGQYVMGVAKAMALPTKGTVEATKVMIEGRLVELDHDPRAVQVEVHEDESGRVTVCLRDSHGTFMRADCLPMRESSAEVEGTAAGEEKDGNGGTETYPSGNEDGAVEYTDLRAQNRELAVLNNELTTQVSALSVEISTLTDKLLKETERVSEVWCMSCEQVASFDETVTASDEEIDRLKARITELERSLEWCLICVWGACHTQPIFAWARARSLDDYSSPFTSLVW